MLFNCVLPSCLIVTLITRIFDTIVFRFFMDFKTALLCCLIITLVTSIFHTFMNRFLMSLKTRLCCGLITTLVASIFHTFMERFLMCLKKGPFLLPYTRNIYMNNKYLHVYCWCDDTNSAFVYSLPHIPYTCTISFQPLVHY